MRCINLGSGVSKTVHIDQSEYHSGTSLYHFGVVIFGTSLILYLVILEFISARRMYVLFKGLYIRYFFDPFRNGVVCPIPGSTIFERSELLICRVHQFGLECVKNCTLQGAGFARR